MEHFNKLTPAELETVSKDEKWISVEDRLPERNEPLIGFNDENVKEVMADNYEATVLGFDPEIGVFKAQLHSWGWSEVGKSYVNGTVKPTHWQPLPSPPINK